MNSNEELIDDYISFKKMENESEQSLYTKKSWLRTFSRDLNKPFTEVKRKDVINHLSQYSTVTIQNKKSLITDFYKYILDLDEDERLPDFLRKIPNPKRKHDDIKYRERYITEDVYNRLLEYCPTPKHKAIIETLYNFGLRKSELTSINYNGVSYDGEVTKVTVRESKTSTRDVIIPGRSKHLLNWVESFYPDKDKPSQPLFFSNKSNREKRYSHSALNRFLMRLCAKADIKRKITPHDFRHTYITNQCKNGIPETHIKTNTGLTKNSKMLSVYDHNKLKDFEEYLKKINVESEPTYDLLEKQKETLEEKHQKEIDELKVEQKRLYKMLIHFLKNKNELEDEVENLEEYINEDCLELDDNTF